MEKNNYITYDDKVDVLYISVNPIKATTTLFDEDFIAVRKSNNILCGLTIEGYAARHIDNSWRDTLITRYIPDFDLTELPQV